MNTPIEEIRARYSPYLLPQPQLQSTSGFRESAVLILLQLIREDLHFVLTLRTKNIGKHSGEVSFPGGKVEPEYDKDKTQTALRETNEEVGLVPAEIELLGYLPDLPTLTRFLITPVVGIHRRVLSTTNWPYPISEDEVERVFLAPLRFFQEARPPLFHENTFEYAGRELPVYSFRYDRYNIWGATAQMIINFLARTQSPMPPISGRKRFTAEEILKWVPRRPVRYPQKEP